MLKSTPRPDVSAGEVARILAGLRAGIDPGKLTREVAARHLDDHGTARRLVDIALACLWLAEGTPADDILTMLECRHRFELSSAPGRAYAVEILWAAECQNHALKDSPNTTPKEPDYATA